VAPEHGVAIEDAYDGWVAAKSAGIRVVLVAEERPDWLDADTEIMQRLDAARILRLLEITSATR
jgi:beta-phosphoglucomutase-like phosphatase (HAD superfamily)